MAERKTSIFIALFALFGAISASFSLYEHTLLHAGAMKGASLCNINAQFNCDAVNRSQYSTLWGVPLASIGLFFYGASASGAVISAVVGMTGPVLGVFLISGVFASLLSLYLFFVAKFVIGYLCLFCMGMYLANFGILASAWRASRRRSASVIHQGLLAPGAFLLSLFKGRPSAWIFLASLALALYGVRLLPSLALSSAESEASDKDSLAVAAWKKRPVAPISIKDGSALDRDYTRGERGAPIEIVEYADFECPACRMFHLKIEQLLNKHPDRISFTAKSFPLDRSCNRAIPREMHLNSCAVSSFVRCAGEQGKFWEAYSEAFTNDQVGEDETGTKAMPALSAWASRTGLDSSALEQCVGSARQMPKIKSDIEEGIALQIESTPSVFVNGRGVHPAQFDALIEALLSKR